MNKTIRNMAVLVLTGLSVAFTNPGDLGHESATIKWTGTKVTGEHTGTVDFDKFDWKFDETGALASANFYVDMNSITCTDLDGGGKTKLEGHLKSQDFFNTTAYPSASFKTTAVESKGKGAYTITGDMTIKDITNSISFDAEISNDGHLTTATATVSIDRTAFDIKYGSGSFFDGLGDKMIHDEFTLDIEIKKH